MLTKKTTNGLKLCNIDTFVAGNGGWCAYTFRCGCCDGTDPRGRLDEN